MEDLIFAPLRIVCPECRRFSSTSIEALRENEEHICPECQITFRPDMDVKVFLEMMKAAESTLNTRQTEDQTKPV